MPKKLSLEVVNHRLSGRGVKIVGQYRSVAHYTEFCCSNGHVWQTTPAAVLNGSGCPKCLTGKRLTSSAVSQRIASRGLVLAGGFQGTSQKATFRCGNGHEWETIAQNVLRGSGCPICCGRKRLTAEIVNHRLSWRGITLAGKFENNYTKAEFRCSYGHEWVATPRSVLQRNGCPNCAEKGFNPSRPAHFYVLISEDGRINLGITNRTIAERKLEHERDDNTNYYLLAYRSFSIGRLALNLEDSVLKEIKKLGFAPIDRTREEFYIPPHLVLSIVESQDQRFAAA